MLYHASTNKNLTRIKPQRTLSKDKYIGDYVFATSDKKLAAMYLATRGVPTLMNTKSSSPRILIFAESTEYIRRDIGGAIYQVPRDSFKKTPQTELEDSELVSEVEVKPIRKKVYSSSISALQEAGIDIYFVDQTQFDEFIKSKNEAEVIAHLEPFRP